MVPERRSSPRVPTYQPIRLQKSGAPSVVETLTKDLSAGGVRCLSIPLFPVSSDLNVELVLTGRGATKRLIAAADYVSRIDDVKHPFRKGCPARKGIEY